jgi:hypothetical protein
MINLTFFSAIFFAIGFAALLTRITNVVGLIFIASIFHAASVANVHTPQALLTGASAYGVTPSMLMALIVGFLWLLMIVRQRKIYIPQHLRWPVGLLISYVLVACLGSVILPQLFSGTKVHLLINMNGANELPIPLVPSLSNIVQSFNLLSLLIVVLYVIATVRDSVGHHRLNVGVGLACTLVLLIGFYEQMVIIADWPSLVPYLANNPGYSQTPVHPITPTLTRIGLPFSEPSYASAYMTAMTIGLLAVALFGRRWWWALPSALLCYLGLLNTMGSTGLVTAVLATTVLIIAAVINSFRKNSTYSQKIRAIFLVSVLTFTSILGWQSYESASWRYSLNSFVQIHIVSKAIQTDGTRETNNRRAFEIVKETYGLGVGLGSNRASSFLASLLSNTGVLGFGLFMAMLGSLLFRYWKSPTLSDSQIFVAIALPTATFAMALGIPDLNMLMYWGFILLGFVFCPGNEAADNSAVDGCPPARA